MGTTHAEIDEALRAWIASQRLFFVATAPLSADGHVNCSPRGGDCFRVLGPREVAWSDGTGSGAETIAHLRENGRIVVLFCAFEGPPRILRLHGRGSILLPGTTEYEALSPAFAADPGARALVHVAVERVSTSCGFGVPRFDYRGERDELRRWAEAKGPEALRDYRARKNRTSIDGLPALD